MLWKVSTLTLLFWHKIHWTPDFLLKCKYRSICLTSCLIVGGELPARIAKIRRWMVFYHWIIRLRIGVRWRVVVRVVLAVLVRADGSVGVAECGRIEWTRYVDWLGYLAASVRQIEHSIGSGVARVRMMMVLAVARATAATWIGAAASCRV